MGGCEELGEGGAIGEVQAVKPGYGVANAYSIDTLSSWVGCDCSFSILLELGLALPVMGLVLRV